MKVQLTPVTEQMSEEMQRYLHQNVQAPPGAPGERDWGLAAHEAATRHLEAVQQAAACAEGYCEQHDQAVTETRCEDPSLGLGCQGCNDCLVREVLAVAWPILEAAVRSGDPFPRGAGAEVEEPNEARHLSDEEAADHLLAEVRWLTKVAKGLAQQIDQRVGQVDPYRSLGLGPTPPGHQDRLC